MVTLGDAARAIQRFREPFYGFIFPPTMRMPAAAWLLPFPPSLIHTRCMHPNSITAAHRAMSITPSMYKKRHALLTFGYCGTGYYGLQSQTPDGDPNFPTVTDVIRKALLDNGAIRESNWSPFMRTKWSLASRTDKGVHAACAAASMMFETLEEDLEPFDEVGGTASDWKLTDAAVARINLLLPDTIRLFSVTRVRKSFNARKHASSRTYEYVLPVSCLNGIPLAEFDAILRTFEGTHKFHNFASGLRIAAAEDYVAGDDSWPLGIDPRSTNRNAHVFRTVLCSRVHRQISIEGCEYIVLRISGLSFVLHQIRHMVGSALAVANNVVPQHAILTALRSPLKVDVSPLAPGASLLLDEIVWWDIAGGEYEAQVPASARTEMERFKTEVIYPHIHSLISESLVFDDFFSRMVEGDSNAMYSPEDYMRLQRIHSAWEQEVVRIVQKRRAESEARQKSKESSSDDVPAEQEPARADRRRDANIPGGLLTSICTHWGLVPGQQSHEMMNYIRSAIANGLLVERGALAYYVDALAKKYGQPTYLPGKDYGTLERFRCTVEMASNEDIARREGTPL